MLIGPKKELLEKHLSTPFKVLMNLEQLEKEEELLNQKIEELIEAEQQLLFRISNELQFKRKRNEELKEKAELLERNCEELRKILKSHLVYYSEP